MTPAEQIIRDEIMRSGPIPFARFMELALYAPGAGYYERPDRPVGRDGDFFTSVSVGPVFGFLLAQYVATCFQTAERFDLVEAASHDGQLAVDILLALERFHPEVLGRIRYRILEPSAIRRAAQQQRLARWGARVDWLDGWEGLGEGVRGILFANELLDAFPVRRFVWRSGEQRWFESGVDVRHGRLEHVLLGTEAGVGDPSRGFRSEALGIPGAASLEAHLPDQFVVEACPAAHAWWRRASRCLREGSLMAFDYGYADEHLPRVGHPEGTLRAYHRHRQSKDLLARPGEQDLTAHVDFQRLMEAGLAEGLTPEAWAPQGRWLGAMAARLLKQGGPAAEWLQAHFRGFQTLTHPEHLGHVFRVLIQRR